MVVVAAAVEVLAGASMAISPGVVAARSLLTSSGVAPREATSAAEL
jgi:hypothetical protein